MKTIIFATIFCFCAALSAKALEYQYANCTGTIYDDKLEVQIKLYNIVTNENKIETNNSYDHTRSIFIPISEWVLTGSNDGYFVDGWDWLNDQFANVVAYTPSFDAAIQEVPKLFSWDDTEISMNFVPYFAVLEARDSLTIDITFDVNDSVFTRYSFYVMHIKMPFIKSNAFTEISMYKDLTESIAECKYFNYHINPLLPSSKQRNYNNYSNIKTDEALIRLLRVAIMNNILSCNCHLSNKRGKEKR